MATELQKKAVDRIIKKRLAEKGGKVAISKVMEEVGYSPMTAQDPKKLTDSKGYKEILSTYGLTEGLITRALVNDIKKKPKKRIMELNLGAEILGMKKRDPEEGNTTNNFIQININPPHEDSGNKPYTETVPSVVSPE